MGARKEELAILELGVVDVMTTTTIRSGCWPEATKVVNITESYDERWDARKTVYEN